jgi:hypothetical protein
MLQRGKMYAESRTTLVKDRILLKLFFAREFMSETRAHFGEYHEQ